MPDSSPHLLRRILALRHFPLFARADLDELATVAENVSERRFEAGELVAPAARLDALHLVVDGRLDVDTRQIEARDVHGALEVMANRPARAPAIAAAPTRTLVLGATDFLEVLEDNFGLLHAALRELAARMIPLGSPRRVTPPLRVPLGLVERIILLRQLAPFAGARLEALAILAHAAAELAWPAATTIHHARAPADAISVILDGSVRIGDRVLDRGHSLGVLETLAGVPHADGAETTTPVRALVIHAATLFDVLEDHTDFALALLRTFARLLVDLETRSPCANDDDRATLARDMSPTMSGRWNVS